MTTYSFSLTLNDSEAVTVDAALRMYIRHCEEQLADGSLAPFWANKGSAEDVLVRLYRNTMMMSTNNFT
jgi:hypothetical protein